MKAKLYDTIQTLVDIHADFDHRDRIILKGTEESIEKLVPTKNLCPTVNSPPSPKLKKPSI